MTNCIVTNIIVPEQLAEACQAERYAVEIPDWWQKVDDDRLMGRQIFDWFRFENDLVVVS